MKNVFFRNISCQSKTNTNYGKYYKRPTVESLKENILEKWDNFLRLKGDIKNRERRKGIINFYLEEMKKRGKSVFSAPSIDSAWLGGGIKGAVLKINGKALKYEDYDPDEEENLEKIANMKFDNYQIAKRYIGRNRKSIRNINASKYINAPSTLEVLEDANGKYKMVTKYEISKCDFDILIKKQKKTKKNNETK